MRWIYILWVALTFLTGFVTGLVCAPEAKAQTVYSTKDNLLRANTGGVAVNTGGTQFTAASCTGAVGTRTTGCIYVEKMTALTLDIDFTDANSSTASLLVTCFSSRLSTCATLRQLPTVSPADATGVAAVMPLTYKIVGSGGGAPGTVRTPLIVAQLPSPWLQCVATCGAGAEAADTITIQAQGITP